MRTSFFQGVLAALSLVATVSGAMAQGQREIHLKATRIQPGISVMADGLVYDNTFNGQNAAYTPGGAVAGTAPITRMVMDDMTFLPGYEGKSMTVFYASVYNGNAAPVSARIRVRFWLANGTGGAPGTYFNQSTSGETIFYTFDFNEFNENGQIPAGTTLFGALTEAPFPKVPVGSKMWVGMSYDNNANDTGYATPAQLNNLGVALYHPAIAGSSQDAMFLTTNPGEFSEVNNPAGATINFGHSTNASQPVASMFWGWAISGFSLYGQATIEGITNPSDHLLLLTFTPVGGGTSFTIPVITTTQGAFDAEVPPGNYNVRIKAPNSLSKTVAANLSAGDVFGANVSLKTGDANNDNVVDISDLLALIGAYNQTSASSGYLPAADFNEDNANDISDLLLLIGNYNQIGS